MECGVENIFRHVRKLISQFEWGLKELPYRIMYEFEADEQSNICMFTHTEVSRNESIFQELSDSGVNISLRGGGLRFAPHYYNTQGEIEQFLLHLLRLK